MTSFSVIEGRLESAGTLGEALGACWVAFECAGLVAESYAALASSHFATWVSVGAPACEGREAVGFAPSMPGTVAGVRGLPDPAQVPEEDAADLLARLAVAIQRCLRGAAERAQVAGDAEACARAAGAAAEIRGLLAVA